MSGEESGSGRGRLSFWSRFTSDPSGFIRRAWFKAVIGPIRYRRGAGYDAERYWSDRFLKYGRSLKGAGHEALSEIQNAELHDEARKVLLRVCRDEKIDFAACRTLEVGCGTGYWTRVLRDEGVRQYTGLDITEVLFPQLSAEFSEFSFVKGDVCRDLIEGAYDLIIMIDVLEHIVQRANLAFALDNIRSAMAPGSVLVVALPLGEHSVRRLFYLQFWSKEDILAHFSGYRVVQALRFRDGHLLAIRKPGG